MNISKAEQRILEINRLIDKASKNLSKLKSYTEVVKEIGRLSEENMKLRQAIREGHAIATNATPLDEKAQELTAYWVRTLYLIDSKVQNNDR